MSIRYVAFDVETPNRRNDRISSIGISRIGENGQIQTEEILINPECEFDDFNVKLTGIKPEMVENAPSFPEVWTKIESLFTNSILIAHNASFDLCVLKKTLSYYKLTIPDVEYICTIKMAKDNVSSYDYKLSTLCRYYGIPLDHHNAGSDSNACARIFLELVSGGIVPEYYVDKYCFEDLYYDKQKYHGRKSLSKKTTALRELNSILSEIIYEGILDKVEIGYLICWMDENYSLKGNYPYDKIYSKLSAVLRDGVISAQEQKELIELFQTVVNPIESMTCSCSGVCITGKNICLSGEFNYGSKDAVSSLLTEKGAFVQTGVTKKTSILIVGGQGSSAWSSGCYGSKIKKALELQSKGNEILIIREEDLFNTIEG